MNRKNCWEVLECGREPGGNKAEEEGVCPASVAVKCNGINHGKNAGRFCWAIAGTYCKGDVLGNLALRLNTCLDCDFFKKVKGEGGWSFKLIPDNNEDRSE